MDNILSKFNDDKIRFTFDNEEELEDLLAYLSGFGFKLVDYIHNYVNTAMSFGSNTLVCKRGCLYTSGEMKKGIKYVPYKEFLGSKYSMPSKDSLMDFLGA